MGSEAPAALIDKVNVAANASINRSSKGKVPKRIHKAEREKLKREHLNELFLDLANTLELSEHNNGKASILCEATRLLKDLFGQIESLKKENVSLLSESNYVMIEKNELQEENSTLETQIGKLQTEIEAKVAQSKPDLNAPPPEFQQPEDTTFQQPAAAVVLIPLPEDLQAYSASAAIPVSKPCSNVSKPHARYPSPSDLWPSQLLNEQQAGVVKEIQLSGSSNKEQRSC